MASSKALVSIWSYNDGTWVRCKSGLEIRTPSAYKGYSTTAVDSSRNASGVIACQVVIEDLAKIELKWNFLTIDEFATISQLFLTKYGGEFIVPVCFFDETAGDWDGDDSIAPSSNNNVRMFYPNDRMADVAQITLDPTTGKPIGYTNVSLHLIDTGKRYV